MQACAADQSGFFFVCKFWPMFVGLDGSYLALLGPLLASPASGLTPSTCGNPGPTVFYFYGYGGYDFLVTILGSRWSVSYTHLTLPTKA